VEFQPDERGEPGLLAYVVPDGEPPTLTRLRAFLWSRLPGCALPSSLHVVPRLPAAGAGAAGPPGPPTEARAAGAPGPPAEAGPDGSALGALWAEVLGLDDPLPGGRTTRRPSPSWRPWLAPARPVCRCRGSS